ncbi:hypothetical protein OBV_p-00610 (plasmid) [Oscillibacter valericigenes Sjm18-20]|nr:hypothetical protein OBV_p-00610 [Oscillibacter valericigenes Sjm18-20]
MNELNPYQMSGYDAIKNLEELFGCYKCCPAACRSCAGGVAIAAIKAECLSHAQTVNEPLTLEQLREMDGEPVWIDGEYPNGWRICYGKRHRKRHGRDVINFGNGVLQFEDEYGKTWLAYRRPLERN